MSSHGCKKWAQTTALGGSSAQTELSKQLPAQPQPLWSVYQGVCRAVVQVKHA